MGLIKKSCMLYSDSNIEASAPNPKSFKLQEVIKVGNHVVVRINYPDCTNYEGNKVLLFLNTTLKYIKQLRVIDPHFSKDSSSPFARFEPTVVGIHAAIILANSL